jgi:hypothetical protein
VKAAAELRVRFFKSEIELWKFSVVEEGERFEEKI